MINDVTVTLLTSVTLNRCCDIKEKVERSSSRPSSHETSEIDKSFTAFVQRPSTDYAEICVICGWFTSLLLVLHAALDDALHLQRVRHAENRRRTETKRSAFSVCCKRDAVALRVRIREGRLHVCGECSHCLLRSARQVLCGACHASRHERAEV